MGTIVESEMAFVCFTSIGLWVQRHAGAGLQAFEGIEFVIETFFLHKLGMVATFDDLAVIHHDDMVCVMDGG